MNEFWSRISPDVAIACVSALLALALSAVTYIYSKRIKFFDTCFERKANAYENVLSSIQNIPQNQEEFDACFSSFRVATLYCSNETRDLIKKMTQELATIKAMWVKNLCTDSDVQPFLDDRVELTSLFRKELKRCRIFKFD